MKKEYVKPSVQWVSMRSSEAVADICWAYARNGKDFFHDIPGYGYCIITIQGGSGCDANAVFVLQYSNPNMTDAQRQQAESYMQGVIAQAKAEAGNKASSYKNSNHFSKNPDPSWS